MKTLLVTILSIFACLNLCNAQSDKAKVNALSFELGKNGLIYNLVFDHKFGTTAFGFRAGAGSNFSKYLNAFAVGGGGYYLSGKRNHYFEVGIDIQYMAIDEVSDDQKGFTLVYPDYSINTIYPSLNLGYRSYGKKGLFRIGFSPGVIDGEFVPGGYISYGLAF